MYMFLLYQNLHYTSHKTCRFSKLQRITADQYRPQCHHVGSRTTIWNGVFIHCRTTYFLGQCDSFLTGWPDMQHDVSYDTHLDQGEGCNEWDNHNIFKWFPNQQFVTLHPTSFVQMWHHVTWQTDRHQCTGGNCQLNSQGRSACAKNTGNKFLQNFGYLLIRWLEVIMMKFNIFCDFDIN